MHNCTPTIKRVFKKKIKSWLSGEDSSEICSVWHIARALFANLCIMGFGFTWLHMNINIIFQNLSSICILVDRFCDPFLVRFRSGSDFQGRPVRFL